METKKDGYWKTPDELGGWYIITESFDEYAGWHYKTIKHCKTEHEANKLITLFNVRK